MKPKKMEIASALGISPAAFSRYVRNGCPVYSIDAARAWQRQHVDPAQRLACKTERSPPVCEDNSKECIALIHTMFALAADDFERYADQVRVAMRALPTHERSRVLVDIDVVLRLLPSNLLEILPPDRDAAMNQSDEDAEAVGAILYGLACGEIRIA